MTFECHCGHVMTIDDGASYIPFHRVPAVTTWTHRHGDRPAVVIAHQMCPSSQAAFRIEPVDHNGAPMGKVNP